MNRVFYTTETKVSGDGWTVGGPSIISEQGKEGSSLC